MKGKSKVVKPKKTLKTSTFILGFTLAFLFFLTNASANPTGVTISDNITESMTINPPSNRTDEGGTITTLVLDVLQQNSRWKAYVGNMSGMLTLSDADGQSIYQWQMGGADLTGNLFISGSDSIIWENVECSNQTMIYDEETLLLFDSNNVDSINRTFNETTHPELTVGLNTIPQDSCRSTSTFVNDAPQSQSNADFPLVLLTTGDRLIYTSPVINQGASYSTGTEADFQAIVPDIDSGDSTTYFFYAEIGG